MSKSVLIHTVYESVTCGSALEQGRYRPPRERNESVEVEALLSVYMCRTQPEV
jgi:hypothetical protein